MFSIFTALGAKLAVILRFEIADTPKVLVGPRNEAVALTQLSGRKALELHSARTLDFQARLFQVFYLAAK